MPELKNPYLNQIDLHRTTIEISGEDKAFLSSLHPSKGVLQSTIGCLLQKFIEQLKKNGITEYDPERLCRAVEASTITFVYGSAINEHPVIPSQTDNRNDGPGVTRVHNEASVSPEQHGSNAGTAKGRKRTGNGKLKVKGTES